MMIGVVSVVSLLFTGCAMANSPASTPPTSAQPDPVSDPAPASSPEPRIGATCQDLLPDEELHTLLSGDVAMMNDAIDHRSPDDLALRQAGALQCFWANEAPLPGWEQHGPDYAYALLDVIPDGQALWARHLEVFRTVYGPSPYGADALGPRCNGADESPAYGSCDFEALVGDYRVNFALTGVRTDGEASNEDLQGEMSRLIDALLARLAEEGDPAPAWSPPGPQHTLGCSAVLTAEQATEITGVSDLYVDRHFDGPATSPHMHGLEVTGANRCAIGIRDSDNEIGDITYLPGGAWAFNELSPSWLSSGAEELVLDDARADENFTLQCSVDAEPCRVDMLVAGDWIQVRIPPWLPEVFSYPPGVDVKRLRGQITEIAQAVLANLHALE